MCELITAANAEWERERAPSVRAIRSWFMYSSVICRYGDHSKREFDSLALQDLKAATKFGKLDIVRIILIWISHCDAMWDLTLRCTNIIIVASSVSSMILLHCIIIALLSRCIHNENRIIVTFLIYILIYLLCDDFVDVTFLLITVHIFYAEITF